MTPVSLCLQHVDRLAAVPDGTVAARLDHALDELERAYRKPSERVVALEAVWQGIDRDPHRSLSALAHFVCAIVEHRQRRWAASV
ncbi:hypothetical protein ASG52_09615 [Methylobacterium sp. Leaf456]|uniref:hypothetical protein n=1 Tax=Methylobacterium sp. Leaf456 TaxID=1736382 RepID=UPI0006FFC180|nr:hypothetical protein [Methylobacterium sp. Leaf456]KQT49215.1 hypothetical protein ASG52_09615 [Methylobacterium sp. Leaf456]